MVKIALPYREMYVYALWVKAAKDYRKNNEVLVLVSRKKRLGLGLEKKVLVTSLTISISTDNGELQSFLYFYCFVI